MRNGTWFNKALMRKRTWFDRTWFIIAFGFDKGSDEKQDWV